MDYIVLTVISLAKSLQLILVIGATFRVVKYLLAQIFQGARVIHTSLTAVAHVLADCFAVLRTLYCLLYTLLGSCLLWVMSTEISVDIAVDTPSIVGRHSVDSRSTLGRQSVDTRSTLGRKSVDTRSTVGRYSGR